MHITIDGFEQMTQQQIFNAAAAHVLKNGAPSIRIREKACQYSGIGCAAAVFIKPEGRRMADDREGGSWHSLVNHDLVPDYEKPLINCIQQAHDKAALKSVLTDGTGTDNEWFVRDFKLAMIEVANEFKLDPALVA